MSLSDCTKCWETPCSCGYEYRHWTEERICSQIGMLIAVLTEKNQCPLQPVIDKILAECQKRNIT